MWVYPRSSAAFVTAMRSSSERCSPVTRSAEGGHQSRWAMRHEGIDGGPSNESRPACHLRPAAGLGFSPGGRSGLSRGPTSRSPRRATIRGRVFAAHTDVPWSDGPLTHTCHSGGGAVVHALAGPARPPRSARRKAGGQRLVAGDERAFPTGRMRVARAGRRVPRRSVVAGRPAVARVHRCADTAVLVSGSQRQHRGRVPRARALAEAERAPERFFINVALVRVLYAQPSSLPRAWRWGDSLSAAAWSATPTRPGGRVPLSPR